MPKATNAMSAIKSEPRDALALSTATSHSRWLVLALLLIITIINFIDRQTVSVLAPVLRQTLHLSNEQYGRIVAAFQFGMRIIFSLPICTEPSRIFFLSTR
jgi:hypothetical protein